MLFPVLSFERIMTRIGVHKFHFISRCDLSADCIQDEDEGNDNEDGAGHASYCAQGTSLHISNYRCQS